MCTSYVNRITSRKRITKNRVDAPGPPLIKRTKKNLNQTVRLCLCDMEAIGCRKRAASLDRDEFLCTNVAKCQLLDPDVFVSFTETVSQECNKMRSDSSKAYFEPVDLTSPQPPTASFVMVSTWLRVSVFSHDSFHLQQGQQKSPWRKKWFLPWSSPQTTHNNTNFFRGAP